MRSFAAASGRRRLRADLGAEQEHRQGLVGPCRLRSAAAWSLVAAALGLFGAGAAAQPSNEAVVCAADDQKPAPCRLQESIRDDGSHVMVFERANTRHTFTANHQSGWWSGTLDGSPAMGMELNRGHMRISTTNLKHRFVWWYPRYEHGTY